MGALRLGGWAVVMVYAGIVGYGVVDCLCLRDWLVV